jgi:hypothetical protein
MREVSASVQIAGGGWPGSCSSSLPWRPRLDSTSSGSLTHGRRHPAGGTLRGHGRANLQRLNFAADTTTHRDRQSPRALTPAHHSLKVEHAPAVTVQAIGVQFVLPLVQALDAAQVDHRPMLTPSEAHRTSLVSEVNQGARRQPRLTPQTGFSTESTAARLAPAPSRPVTLGTTVAGND